MSFALTPNQITHYHEHGYVVIPNVLSTSEIESYKACATKIANGNYPKEAKKRLVRDVYFSKGIVEQPKDPELSLWKILNPDRFDPLLDNFIKTPKLLDGIESLIGKDILAFLLMYIYKPPGVPETIHPFHQDGVYFPFQPLNQCIGTWTPLDDATGDNGTLEVIDASHKLELQSHGMRKELTNAFAFEVEGFYDHPDKKVLEVKAGDSVLFHPHLLHTTGGNKTKGHRRVLTVHLASANCQPTGMIKEFGFQLVRGQTYEHGLQAIEHRDLAFSIL